MDPLLGPGMERAFTQKKAILTQALNLAGKNDSSQVHYAAEHTSEWAAKLSTRDANPAEPLVRFLYPVLKSALSIQEPSSASFAASEAVAVVASSFYFGTLLRGILPAGQNGLIVVIHNDCGMSFTYVLNGEESTFLGLGDLHDDIYDKYALSLNFTELDDFIIGDELDYYYAGLPIDASFCMYNVTIFPSEVMEDEYRSNDPIIFTYSVIAIFLITSICFLGYDRLVADRQQKVIKSAQKSNAIISSLFPSNIRDRLFVEGGNGSNEMAHIFQPNKARLRNFLHDEDDPSKSGAGGGTGSKPIADLFTDCTVMFADIANFTAWSSVREPGQVFTLLETLYGAFDQIAAKRGVFKVEVSCKLDIQYQDVDICSFLTRHSLSLNSADHWRFLRCSYWPA
jgi:Adenylate and Guanylate cyclase catalytic domain